MKHIGLGLLTQSQVSMASEFDGAEEDSMQLFMGFVISAVNKRTLKYQPDF